MCVCSAHLGAAFEKLFDGGAGAEGRAEGGAEGAVAAQECGECSAATAEGRVDDANGTWYCTNCWTSFESY